MAETEAWAEAAAVLGIAVRRVMLIVRVRRAVRVAGEVPRYKKKKEEKIMKKGLRLDSISLGVKAPGGKAVCSGLREEAMREQLKFIVKKKNRK